MATTSYRSDGSHLGVDPRFWDRLARRDPAAVARLAGMDLPAPGIFQFRFLDEAVRIDVGARRLLREVDGRWAPVADPLLEMVSVIYLGGVSEIHPVGKDVVGVGDLKEWHFFTGPHAIEVAPLLERFGRDAPGFRRAAEALGGRAVDFADAAYRMMPFPRIALYYLLWEGDAEFPPELKVLYDRPIERVLQADAIWALTNRVTRAIASA